MMVSRLPDDRLAMKALLVGLRGLPGFVLVELRRKLLQREYGQTLQLSGS